MSQIDNVSAKIDAIRLVVKSWHASLAAADVTHVERRMLLALLALLAEELECALSVCHALAEDALIQGAVLDFEELESEPVPF